MTNKYSTVDQAIKILQSGRPVIIVDDSHRENEGDLVVAAELINPYNTNFLVRHSSGVICVATTASQLQKLKLNMVQSKYHSRDSLATPFTLSCEASSGVTTGISAADRATTIRAVANPDARINDIIVPGHVFPLIAHENGLKGRLGHTEASVELCKLAKLWPAAAISEIANESGGMMKGEALDIFSLTYNVPIISIQQIKEYSLSGHTVTKITEANLPTKYGDFKISIWKEQDLSEEHIVLSKGNIKDAQNVPVRVHSQCLTGDVFHSKKCDCGSQLAKALQYINEKGFGMLLWMRQEGRGIGLANKIKAYHLQDTLGLDTIEANLKLNLPIDCRDFKSTAQIIEQFQPASVSLLTNNPKKIEDLKQYLSVPVNRVPLPGELSKENSDYLNTKKNKMSHMIYD